MGHRHHPGTICGLDSVPLMPTICETEIDPVAGRWRPQCASTAFGGVSHTTDGHVHGVRREATWPSCTRPKSRKSTAPYPALNALSSANFEPLRG